VRDTLAVSAGTAGGPTRAPRVNCTVYVPAATPKATVNDSVVLANFPVPSTVTDVCTKVIPPAMTVVPLRSCADESLPAPTEKPEPEMVTTAGAPATTCVGLTVMFAADRTVKVAGMVFTAASVTATVNDAGAVDAGTTRAGFSANGTLPLASLVSEVVFASVTVLNQLAAEPPKVIVSPEFAANPFPEITVYAPALTAVGLNVMLGVTEKAAVAETPPAVTVIVCVPAAWFTLGMVAPV